MTLPDPTSRLEAIGSAARQEEQSLSPSDNISALKESDDLFAGLLRKLYWSAGWVLYFLIFIFCSIFLVRTLHWLLPDQYCWLTPAKLTSIDTLLSSGGFIALGGIGKDFLVNSLTARRR